MFKKTGSRIFLISLIIFAVVYSAFSEPGGNLTAKQAESVANFIKGNYKIYYYCENCPGSKSEVKILNNLGFEPIVTDSGYQYQLFINEKEFVNPQYLYIFRDEKWQNLGSLVGIGGSPEILPVSKYPLDIETIYLEEAVKPSDLPGLTILEKKLFSDINEIRQSPQIFAEKIRSNLKYLQQGVWKFPGRRGYKASAPESNYLKVIDTLSTKPQNSPFTLNENLSLGAKKNRLEPSSLPLYTRYDSFLEKPEFLHMYEINQSGTNVSTEILANLLAHDFAKYSKVLFDEDFQFIGISCGPIKNNNKCMIVLSSGLKPPDDFLSVLEEFSAPSDISYLTLLEKKIIEETNFIRSNPKEYAKFLKELRPFYKGKIFKRPILAPLNTEEGITGLEEAIAELEKAPPVSILQPNKELSRSSESHVKDTGPKGTTGHTGSDGSSPTVRMLRFKKDMQLGGENIAYGYHSARDIVMQLYIDDAVYDRGHRKNLMYPDYRHIGVSCGKHKTYRIMCVQNFGNW